MSKFSPQDDTFKIISTLNKTKTFIFYSIFILAIVLSVFENTNSLFIYSISVLDYILIFSFYILTYLINYYLYPKAEEIRRSDFIDNALNTKFNIKSSEEYFTNDNIEEGIYKIAVNLFENCYFTKEISGKMLSKRTIFFVISSIIILLISIQGLKNSLFTKSILQLYLSIYVLGNQIKLFTLHSRMTVKFERLKNLFSRNDLDLNNYTEIGRIIKMYIDYETDLAVLRVNLDSNIFNKMNPKLSENWNEIKNKYEIK
jgi:hypothetical protein